MKLKRIIVLSLLVLGSLFLISCVSVSYPARQQYMLNVKLPDKIKTKSDSKVLEIKDVTVVPQFANLAFVYRLSDIKYTTDYYNLFFNAPAAEIKQNIINYIQTKKLFKQTVSNDSIYVPNYMLNAEVLELYADYRDSNHPKAVMSIHFTYYNMINKKPNVLIAKTYQVATPLGRKDSVSLVSAWNKDLAIILSQLTRDINFSS